MSEFQGPKRKREKEKAINNGMLMYYYIIAMFVSWNSLFGKLLFKLSCVCLPLKNWSTENTFQSKKNLTWFSGKCFPEKFGRKTLFGSCEKIRNVILFADYIKFGPQTFDCYIYFVLNIYFSISSLKI